MKLNKLSLSTYLINNHIFILSSLYFTSFSPLLINNGIFWDDWCLYNVDKAALVKQFQEVGGGFMTYIHLFFISFSFGPLIVKWLVFILFFLSSILFYRILIKTNIADKTMALFLTLFFALLPFNFARITTICIGYSISNFAFLLAFYILILFFEKHKLIFRLLSLSIFFISFYTNSLLVFYLITIIYLGIYEKVNIHSLKNLLTKYIKYIDFILLPLIFWIHKKLLFPTSGPMETYNQINIKAMILSPISFIFSLKSSFIDTIANSLTSNITIILLLALIIYFVFTNKDDNKQTSSIKGILVGLLLLFLGIFPYLAIGRLGSNFGTEWQSRDQLLLPIGASFILYFSIHSLLKEFNISKMIRNILFSILLSAFCINNFSTYWQFNVDWLKQLSFIENIKSISEIKYNSTFIVTDNTREFDAIKRNYRFYEYSGLMKLAFNTETRLAAKKSDFEQFFQDSLTTLELTKRPYFCMNNYRYSKPQYEIIINNGNMSLTIKNTIILLFKHIVYPSQFNQEIKEYISVSTKKILQ